MSYLLVDVLRAGPWTVLRELEDPDLRRLAEALPETVLRSRADSTTKKYLGAFKRWRQWATDHQLQEFPVFAHHIVLYLQHIAQTSGSKAAMEEAIYALAWAHGVAGVPSPTDNPFVRTTVEGLRRALSKPTQKKEPITADMLKAMVEDTREHNTLSNVRLTMACLLAFAGFLRFNELVNIRPRDLSFSDDMLKLYLPHSKTDQLRKGNEVIIARTKTQTCPVSMLERYMEMGKIPLDSQQFLFRHITRTKQGERLKDSGVLSYSTLRDLFKAKVRQLGYPAEQFGLHSLRAGGASAAANADVPDRLFKRHGRWKSENAKDGYVEDSLEKWLSVTKNIGL